MIISIGFAYVYAHAYIYIPHISLQGVYPLLFLFTYCTPVHKLMSFFLQNKIYNLTVLSLSQHFWPKYASIIHNNTSSSERFITFLFRAVLDL